MRTDIKEDWRGSIIQHGKENDRIYLMSLDASDAGDIIPYLDALALEKGYTKIFAKVPAEYREVFTSSGYHQEAFVEGFYKGEKDALFMGKFFSADRELDQDPETIKNIIKAAEEKASLSENALQPGQFKIRRASPADIPDMCRLYREVFESYPFPVHDEQYLLGTMRSNVRYYAACKGNCLAGISSSEMDPEKKNTEMTDFATMPEYRKMGLATELLRFMDIDMTAEGIVTSYTIARARSYGMNIAFAKNGYRFSGTLVNNTNIAGAIESMNVWYKKL
jgi:beta-lysine N6-acetyltransferase